MNISIDGYRKVNKTKRKVNPNDIQVPDHYKVEVFAKDLDTPISLIITENSEMLLADSGIISGSGKVLKLKPNGFQVIAEGFNPPLTGITYYKEKIYVSHRGFISVIHPNGTMENIISGLPSLGDHHNNQVVFSTDGKMYFGQGTATNSGVVGMDNEKWVKRYPFFHDYPGVSILLRGENYLTPNFLRPNEKHLACTGAFTPFGISTSPNELVKNHHLPSGSILRANPDGSNLELVAWGLRNPFRMKFDCYNRLFCTNHGADVRGSRPIANCPDEFQLVTQGNWYGWPDYSGGLPVTLPKFKPENMPAPAFLLRQHPMIPPKPFVIFPPHSATMGFDFNYNKKFGDLGDAYIAQFAHRISKLDMHTKKISPFAINKSGSSASSAGCGGLEHPIDILFDKNGSMFVLDFGLSIPNEPGKFAPGTGVIWKITNRNTNLYDDHR